LLACVFINTTASILAEPKPSLNQTLIPMDDTLLDRPSTGQAGGVDFDTRAAELIRDGFTVEIRGWIRKGWEIFQKEPGYFIGLLILSQGLSLGVQLVGGQLGEFVGVFATIAVAVLLLPMQMGYAILARKIMRNEPYTFSDMFGGYKLTGELIVVYLLYAVLVVVGMVFLVLPGIYLAIAFSWAPYLLLFYNKPATEALSISRKLLHKSWWGMFLFLIVAGLLLNIAGLLVCLVGILVSLPVSYISMYVALDETLGLQDSEPVKEEY